MDCDGRVMIAEHVRGTNPLTNDVNSLRDALHVAECCRIKSRFDLASEVLNMIEAFPASYEQLIRSGVTEIRRRCGNKDFSGTVIETSTRSAAPEQDSSLPPILIRGLNFASAMARHAANGFKRCSKKQIDERLAICQSCPHLVDNHCQLCGCACIETNQLMNKLALASEACPLGKWK